MSNPVRIGLVVEGPTDVIVLRSAFHSLLGNQDFQITVLQPELSEAFSAQNAGGWTSIYFWCRSVANQACGAARNNSLFDFHDVLIVQVDADVAGMQYCDDKRIHHSPNDLPCELPCPPARDTTDALRRVILGWLDEKELPPHVILCTPSKSLETWVLAALFPNDPVVKANIKNQGSLECFRHIQSRLQSKPLNRRLIRSGQKLIDKYLENENSIKCKWPFVMEQCAEARRFAQDLIDIVLNKRQFCQQKWEKSK